MFSFRCTGCVFRNVPVLSSVLSLLGGPLDNMGYHSRCTIDKVTINFNTPFKEIYVIFIGTGLLCQACLTKRWVHRENVLQRWPKYRVLFCMHAFLNFRLNVSKVKRSSSSYQASMNRTVVYYYVNSILVCGTFFVESLVNSNSCSLWRVHIKKIS